MQEPLLVIGLLLVAGVACGWIARRVKLPTLTGHIAAGLLLGKHGLDAFAADRAADGHGSGLIDSLSTPVNDLAMALVLFVLGAQFRLDKLKKSGKPVLTVSAIESTVTFILVTAVSWVAIGSAAGAALLGVMSVAVAPATTIVVLREYRAKGPATDAVKMLTALSNVWAVLVFEIILVVFLALQGGAHEAGPGAVVIDLFGSLLFGLIAGHLLIVLQERTGHGNYSVPLLTVLCLTIGVCKITEVPHMMTFLVTGAVVVNRSQYFDPISKSMDVFAKPAFVLFFVLSGLHLDFTVLRENWLAVSLYVLARTLGKILGARAGMRVARWNPSTLTGAGSPPLGLGLLCQAGAAIALATYVGDRYDEELGATLLNVVLGGVLVFELIGPLLVKRVALAAGEISLGELLAKGTDSRGRGLLQVLGFPVRGHRRNARSTEIPTVERMMRRSAAALPARANLDEILKFANHSPFNHFPVVRDDGRLLGLIALSDLDQVAYDRRTTNLVIAADMATLSTEEAAIAADEKLPAAVEFFRSFAGNTAAVFAPDDGHLVGMLERAEVMNLARALHVV